MVATTAAVRTETRQQQIDRLIERHIRDRNMDPRSIEETYKFTHVGIELDPDFFEARLDMGWGFFKDQPRYLDHITRNMIIFTYLAYRRSTGCFHQGRKGVMMGATYEQMVEALEAAHTAGGGLTLHHGFEAILRMQKEGLVPGCQEGPWNGHWVQFDYRPGVVVDPMVELPMPLSAEQLEDNIRRYYSAELGASQIADDLIYASRIDPEFWSRYCRLAWGVYQAKPCFLDPIRRELMILGIYAFQGRTELVEFHIRRALLMGAPVEALMEAIEVTFVGSGNRILFDCTRILRKVTGGAVLKGQVPVEKLKIA
ncbi:carboxymuconolactone decarboxylase family protein [Microvirga zambiensis]|uniref:carboxymuconolactone decarboxylase family protein n=1 Tax=Microvirga zambiensis TaxID=1402137 RepID=UPI00191E46A0|nr:carboxymuconolactone decarboxylase family protein [Microvirga zambiensis]